VGLFIIIYSSKVFCRYICLCLDVGQFLFYAFFVVQIDLIAIFVQKLIDFIVISVGQKLIEFIVSCVDQLPIDSRRVSKNVLLSC
jgi:hypothetical protein